MRTETTSNYLADDEAVGLAVGESVSLRKPAASVIALLAANAGVALCYFALDLGLLQLAVVYWWECLWIGIFCVLKLLVAAFLGDPYGDGDGELSRLRNVVSAVIGVWFVGAKFLVVFLVLGFVLVGAFQGLDDVDQGRIIETVVGPALACSIVLLIAHGFSFYRNFIVRQEYKTARSKALLSLPFRRCVALAAGVLLAALGAHFVPGLADTAGFAVLVVLVKLLWDSRAHRKERLALAG
jgi:hypothetical protein